VKKSAVVKAAEPPKRKLAVTKKLKSFELAAKKSKEPLSHPNQKLRNLPPKLKWRPPTRPYYLSI